VSRPGALARIAVLAAALAASPALAQPGSTPSGPQPAAPGPPASRAAFGTDAKPLGPQELEVLKEVEAAYLRYKEAADDHHLRMRTILLRELHKRTADLEKRYAERIRKAEEEKRRRHLDTIALLEKFIEEHPDHEQFTPDAMFRLADLYLDAAEADLEAREVAGNFDDDPMADYSKSVRLWEQIIERFPGYRQLPGTLYLLAHYGKIKDERKSLKLFLALVCANKHKWDEPPPPMRTREQVNAVTESRTLDNPYSDCVPLTGAEVALLEHAWVRGVGDHHFSVPGELNEAIAAYGKVTLDKSAGLYAEALYKLAWSYYRRDFLLESIQHFDESVVLYDATVARGEQPKLELRDEALQYIAVSFTDPWNNEPDTRPELSLQRAQEFYKGRENEPHVRDVWVTLGKAFMDLQAYDQAIDSFGKAIGQPWHLHPSNPVVHQDIVNAFEAKGDKYGADEAAAELAIRYAPGTPWYTANEKDREAMDNQRSIGERMLYAAARNMHSAATRAREEYVAAGVDDPAAKQAYLDLYDRAIQLYKSFLDQYRESEHVYVFTFGMAEALFFREKYLEAIEHYRWVRDHRELSSQHFQDAAYSIIQAYDAEATRQAAAGQVAAIQVPTTAELKAMPQPVQPQSIPPIHRDLQQAYDEYQKLVSDPRTAPQMALNAGLISLSYLHLDDALLRFQIVLDRFCGSHADAVAMAKDGLLSIYEARGQDQKFKETNDRFISAQCGDAKSIALAQSQNRSIEFRKAAELFAANQFAEAAKGFYVYYKTAPADDKDLPTALYNSAIAYREADKPKTAIHLLKEFTDNKSEAFRKSPYYLAALRLTASSYQSVFDYKSAISTYLELYEQARTAPKRGLTPPPPPPGEEAKTFEEIQLDALYNAAVLSELNRDFDRAIQHYKKYEREEPDRRLKDRALWSMARIYRSAGDIRNLVDTYDQWRRKYGNDEVNKDDYVFSYHDIAEAHAKRRRNTEADKYRQETIKAWERKGAEKRTRGAELAGEHALYFAEKSFSTKFLPYKIKNQAKTKEQAKTQREALDKVTKAVQDEYLALGRFGVGDYAMAAKVRDGEILTLYAQKVFEMPTPKYVLDLDRKAPDLELLAQYESALAQSLQKLVEEAKKQWQEVVSTAKDKSISNKWTELALENLNREFPDEYPILHEALREGTEAP
jgi:cellulose synthase operon protein C